MLWRAGFSRKNANTQSACVRPLLELAGPPPEARSGVGVSNPTLKEQNTNNKQIKSID